LLHLANTTSVRRALAALAGALVLPVAAPAHAASGPSTLPSEALLDEAPSSEPPAPVESNAALPDASCLASTICSLKEKVRWGVPGWTPAFCARIAEGVLASSRRNNISPSLLLAVMVGESDMNDKAANVVKKNGRLYAKDSGLMGIRCIFGKGNGMCTNGYVRGLSWKKVMDPVTNIELGARELARWRTGGVTRKMVTVREGNQVVKKQKFVYCQHKNHAFWAHYNHGLIYIDHGFARHYPQRVAVLQTALARALDVEAPELKEVSRLTVRDRGERERTADRPVEPRFRKLCSQIAEVGGQCSSVASLAIAPTVN
jgi:hypothetical protein